MPEAGDRRRDMRIQAGVETHFSSELEDGRAVLTDISAVDALLEQTSLRPPVGARVRLTLFLPNRGRRLEVVGRVDRHTREGFAIDYETPNAYLCASVVEENASSSFVGETDRQDFLRPEKPAEAGGRGEAPVASEGDPSALAETLEFIIEVALDGRHGGVEPEEALDTIIDRAHEMLDAAKAAREVLEP